MTVNGFQDRRIRPLCQLSATKVEILNRFTKLILYFSLFNVPFGQFARKICLDIRCLMNSFCENCTGSVTQDYFLCQFNPANYKKRSDEIPLFISKIKVGITWEQMSEKDYQDHLIITDLIVGFYFCSSPC